MTARQAVIAQGDAARSVNRGGFAEVAHKGQRGAILIR